jgi:hypothetical protein
MLSCNMRREIFVIGPRQFRQPRDPQTFVASQTRFRGGVFAALPLKHAYVHCLS